MHLVDFNIAGRVTKVECHAVLTINPAACTILKKKIKLLEIMHEKQQPLLSWSHPCFGSPSHPCCCSITCEEQLLCSLNLWGQKYLNTFLLLLPFFFSKLQSDRKVKLVERAGGVVFPDYLSIREQRCDPVSP